MTQSTASPPGPALGGAHGAPPAALLIDFGGVLTAPIAPAFAAVSRAAGLAPEAGLTALATHAGARAALAAHEIGQLDDAGFEAAFAAALNEAGGSVAAEGLLARLAAEMVLDEAMIALVRQVRAAGIPVALVSNSLGSRCYDGVDLDELLDVVVISGREGVRKPSRRIYALACARLGVEPERCVFIDDLEHNLNGAARLGIAGVLHGQTTHTIAQTRALFGLSAEPTGRGGNHV